MSRGNGYRPGSETRWRGTSAPPSIERKVRRTDSPQHWHRDLSLADGRRVFVKAIGPDYESGAPGGQDIYRREARIVAGLPGSAPVPRLMESWEADNWVVLLFEEIGGGIPRFHGR